MKINEIRKLLEIRSRKHLRMTDITTQPMQQQRGEIVNLQDLERYPMRILAWLLGFRPS